MVAHVGALHDHVHVVQVGKDRILQALTVVGADRFQNIRVLLNDRFFCLMMDGEQTCPAIMYILRTGMLQHELTVGQRIEDMVEIFIQTEHGCNVIHCAGGPLLFHNGAQIRIDRSKCAGIERFQTDMGFQNFAQVAGLLHLLAVDQAEIFVRRRMDIGEGTNEARMVRQEEYLAQLSAQLESRVQQDQQFTAQVYDALQPYLVTDLAKGQLVNEVWAAKDDIVEPAIALEGEHKVAEDGFTEFYPTEASIQKAVLTLFWEPVEE